MKVAFHAGGYVGITGALHHAKAGHEVIVYDPDQAIVDGINRGKPKAGSFLDYLGGDALRCGTQVKATTDREATLDAAIHFIAVPSERDGEPWMDIVLETFRWIDHQLYGRSAGDIPIIVESTVMPGIAKELRTIASHMRPWAIAPRRDWFADPEKNLHTLTRIVGRDKEWHQAIEPWITTVCRDIQWTTPETAELTKALENAVLALPVMLLHELALLFPEYDIVEAAELVSTHWRFRSLGKLYMGLGIGGRCIPLGPKYLAGRGGSLLSDAIELNEQFADLALLRIIMTLDPELLHSALVLGVAYRPSFRDAGHSPGLRVVDTLRKYAFETITITDPCFMPEEIAVMLDKAEIDRVLASPFGAMDLGSYDLVVLTVAHSEFRELWQELRPGVVVIDATGAWEGKRSDWHYIRPGREGWINADQLIEDQLLERLNVKERI